MLAKKKAAKRAAMKAAVEASRGSQTPAANAAVNKRQASGNSSTSRRAEATAPHAGARPVLTRRDALEAGSDGRSDLIKRIGDNVNTRLQEISFADDIDADLFDERKRELLEEARLAAGTQQRVVSDDVSRFVEACVHATRPEDGEGLPCLRIRHNSNSVTAVAHLGAPPEVVVFGDKAGKVYLVDLAASTSAQGLVHSAHADARRHQKVLLAPAMNAAVVSMAVSDTRDARPSTRDLFEKSTVDTSCTSYIVAGAADGAISVWETATRKHKGFLTMHKKPITGLSFRALTSTLFSVCQDGTLRVWSVPQMLAVDKLFGHEGTVYGVDALRRESCASVGQDGTMRFWNVPAATQQAYAYLNTYHPHARPSASAGDTATAETAVAAKKASSADKPYAIALECVAMLSEQLVVAGAVDGSLILFDVNRRKPLHVVPAAHGYDYHGDGTGLESAALALQEAAAREGDDDGESEGTTTTAATRGGPRVPNPITAVAAVPYADVIASASYDGVVRLWTVSAASSFIPRGGHAASAKAKTSTAAGQADAAPASSTGTVMQLLAEVPVHALVTSIHLSVTGDALIVGCSKEPRLGRWVVRRAAMNSVCVFPLTGSGFNAFKHVVGLSIEHVPALLYGFDEGSRSDEEAEGEAGEAHGSSMARGLPLRVDEENVDDGEMDEGDQLDMTLAHLGDGEEEDPSAASSPLFTVGPDGELQFRPSARPTIAEASEADALRRVGLKKQKKMKTKGGKKAVGGEPTGASKKAKKAPRETGKRPAAGARKGLTDKKKKKPSS